MKRKWLRFAPVALFVLVVASLVWRLSHPPDTTVESEMIGKAVPGFTLPAALAGTEALSSANLADGRPKLVNFFASWCVPCIGEAPVLTELKQQGVPIVGIAVRDRTDDLARFLDENGNPFERIGADSQSRVQLSFGSSGVPETFVVDGRGIIRLQHIGPIEPDDVPALLEAVRNAR
ncbi:DsbE family thiol:disulfide interchange protein [Sphingomonas sp. RG327]|jgi:cytochrome c biogenesis protein CcmG/thiol:disulfide interchange protein DsbE|uniref:DsbE family thiol:disulfide interchange protein n=1 Tax=Sphingomonas anseongensis TaxID=2908207 RepID=A0ABT0RD50_9SPHN|nr:DsbE family thiol:disulfide interchange protein [Sphingomonas anseongensis]MCL6678182.1 DsbE family thiol:disulfide interchange protein [Sphingomonas anseongensis]